MKTLNLKPTILLLALSLLSCVPAFATTWDEPWIDKVVKEADHFVMARILESDEDKGAKLEIIKTLGGKELSRKVKVEGFFLLDIRSMSAGHGPEFHFGEIDTCYFFLKRNAKGVMCMPTPTTGFDYVRGGKVIAAFRHSYHKCMVPVEVYEMAMRAIFNHAHGQEFDRAAVAGFVSKQLGMKPMDLRTEGEAEAFFLQHAALELIYHLRLEGYCAQILPFLAPEDNFHANISAARALVSCKSETSTEALLAKIASKDSEEFRNMSDFVKVVCIWTLREYGDKSLKSRLEKLVKTASTEYGGFGGNIMDPRVGTHFPTVKEALEKLIAEL